MRVFPKAERTILFAASTDFEASTSFNANSVLTSTISSPSKQPVKKHSSIRTDASRMVSPPGTEKNNVNRLIFE